MLQDRTEINKSLSIDRFFPPFFSVLLPELGRPQYLKECVESIHKFADLPVEIIVHDDGSGDAKQRQILDQLGDKVSTLVLNRGYNTGLARSFNRCRAMASSKYLIGFNTDTYMTTSFLQKMKTALDLPYVGIVNVVRSLGEGRGVYTTPDGTKVGLLPGTGTFHCAGVRAEVWDAAGGWDENVQTTSSDVGFMGTIFGMGLFAAAVEGTVVNEMWYRSADGLSNDSNLGLSGNPAYISAADFTRGDNNLPPVFGWNPHMQDRICEIRREEIWRGVNLFIQQEQYYPFWYNNNYQCQQVNKMFLPGGGIDWVAAETHGHARWKDRIIQDFNLA